MQRNAYYAHPYQLLFAMCLNEDEAVRRNAVNKIRNLRDQHELNTQGKAISKNEEGDKRSCLEKSFLDKRMMIDKRKTQQRKKT